MKNEYDFLFTEEVLIKLNNILKDIECRAKDEGRLKQLQGAIIADASEIEDALIQATSGLQGIHDIFNKHIQNKNMQALQNFVSGLINDISPTTVSIKYLHSKTACDIEVNTNQFLIQKLNEIVDVVGLDLAEENW